MRKILILLATVLAVTAASLSSPAWAEADRDGFQSRGSIVITSNEHFDAEHGVVSGKGTASDPYVIAGWDVARVQIKDTSKHVVIRNNRIQTLILDWIGPGVRVVNNDVGDMRVNQNVRRTGDMTSGLIAHNTFRVVGQLRHWDGVFEHNLIGSPSSCMNIPFFRCRAVNFDGFNGARFRNNTMYGYLEVRLHGHHHSSSFGHHSHYHGTEHADMVDHSKRFHRVSVTNNTIYSGDHYGLVYTDSAHSANDRTAASETNPDLEKPHVHKTKVLLAGNEVHGAGIEVNIFNADDTRHLGTRTGSMTIKNNKVFVQKDELQADEMFYGLDGIAVSRATDVKLDIVGNFVDGSYSDDDDTASLRKEFDYGAGIYLWDIDKARVRILDNRVAHRTYGVRAAQMTESVEWWIGGLKTSNVEHSVYYDRSVANEPQQARD